ncbi:MAG: hypothetical protein ACRD0O_12470 [Acidimicrobiia bacterium]
MTGAGGHSETTRGRIFWAALVTGWAVMAYGVIGALSNTRDTRPSDLARWFFGAAVAHDAVLAPVVLLIGTALGKLLPGRLQPPVQGGLIVMGVIALFAFPLVQGYGVRPDNPTVVFRNYAPALLVVLAIISLVTAGLTVRAGRRQPPPTE